MGQKESHDISRHAQAAAADRIQRAPRNVESALCDSAKRRIIQRERVPPAPMIGHSVSPRITVVCGTPFLIPESRNFVRREGRMFCLGRQAYRCAQATVTAAELTKPHKRMRKDRFAGGWPSV